MNRTPLTDWYWQDFTRRTGHCGSDYVPIKFGDSKEMANALLELVLIGQKRATASLLCEYPPGGDALPRGGDHVVACDGDGAPRAIWRTTDVSVKRLDQADAGFAWDEGEGDRTLADWLDGHARYFRRQARREGFRFDPSIPTVFERFTLIWPPEHADRAR
jgi:uncharacterized protein YhfF